MANKSKYQKFIVEEIHRSEIRNAEYNPRMISEDAKKRLRRALQKHGLVEAIVWNRMTGNLVSGHQRLDILDALEKSKDYTLDVCVIAVDAKEEATINVTLNNHSTQGEFDLEKLANLAIDFDIGFEEMGFTKTDIDFMFDGDDRFSDLFETPEAQSTKNALAEIKEAREQGNERCKERGNINFYSMLVFKDEEEKKEFYRKINTPIFEEVLSVEMIQRIAKAN